jgi:ribosomal protein S18 acetylase RimI-like enzyme
MYVLAPHQRQGTGRGLFLAACGALRDAGHYGLLLWVLESNPARGFYERMGGEVVARREEQLGDLRLTDIGYGWRDPPDTGARVIPDPLDVLRLPSSLSSRT